MQLPLFLFLFLNWLYILCVLSEEIVIIALFREDIGAIDTAVLDMIEPIRFNNDAYRFIGL